jgi:hypothetical protein
MTDTPELNAQGPNLTPTHNMINAYLRARLLETGVRGFDISQQAEHEHGSRCIMCPQLTARFTHRPYTHIVSTNHPVGPDSSEHTVICTSTNPPRMETIPFSTGKVREVRDRSH